MKKTWWCSLLIGVAVYATPVPWFVDFMHLEHPEWALPSRGGVSPVIVSNGHFYNTSGRVRFWGVNITGDKNFPLKVDAPRIARSLRLLGVNSVRLHFMEHSWGEGSLLASPEGEDLDTNALERLDYFIACLKQEGVYVNMNLHVGRVFPEIPASDRDVFELGKIVGYIDERLVESQKRYATRLLGHTNPYTGLPYTVDPVVAVIEVNNENALTGIHPDDLARLSSYYQKILREQWNDFLHRRYGNFSAWEKVNRLPEGKSLFVSQTNQRQRFYWRWEAHENGRSRFDWQGDTLVWRVEHPGKETWHNQFMCAGFPVVSGMFYEIRFEAKSVTSLPLVLYLMQDEQPWNGLGFYTNVKLTPEWRVYTFRFMAAADEAKARLNFSTEKDLKGTLEMRNFVLREMRGEGIDEDRWKTKGIPLPWEGLGGKQVIGDFRAMLCEREKQVVTTLRQHIRSLGCKKPVTHTQITYGGLAGLVREAHLSDFVDVHAYWQHPEFPRKAWSPTDWFIGNTSQLTDEGLGPLSYVAYWRVAGKPFTVSEYNVPDPSWYGFEAPIWLALWGAFQDWDGVYLYTLLDFGGKYYQKNMTGFFHFIGSGGKMSLLPWAARVFRGGIEWPYEAKRGCTFLEAEQSYIQRGAWHDIKRQVFWSNESLFARVSVDLSGKSTETLSPRMPWVWDREKPFLVWQREDALLLTGNIQGMKMSNEIMILQAEKPTSWGVIAMCTLDERPWKTTAKILAVVVGRGENTAMQWNPQRTSVGTRWGRAPYVLFQPAWRVYLPGFRAYLLDERGEKRQEVFSSGGWFVFGEDTPPWIVFEKP
ncbi:MAG: hypothetical protein N2314_00015 [Brevinematales bacterium]|nr:hypothetical protein [Brevinematales bacterium]